MNIPKDSAMLLDIQYIGRKRVRDENNKAKWLPDYLYIIWRDLDTGEKHVEMIPNPPMEIWFENGELRNHDYIKDYIRKKDAKRVVCKYTDFNKVIADDWGDKGKEILHQYYNTLNRSYLDQLRLSPYVFGNDVDIRTFYRHEWKLKYSTDKKLIFKKGFFDIESDILEATVSINDPNYLSGVSPIDLVTVVDDSTNTSYTFALLGVDAPYRNKKDLNDEEKRRIKLYDRRLKAQDYWYNHPEELNEKIHEAFGENYPNMKFNVYFYTDELKMLVHLFQMINGIDLDFLGAWNISYDIPEIIGRLKFYGVNPEDVICPKDFPNKQCYFKKDNIHYDVKNKTHFFRVTARTIYYDAMVKYGAIRKGGSEIRSLKLNDVARDELGDEKYDYSELGGIKTLSYKNWLTYFIYNIKDVLLLKDLENKTNDVETFYYDSYLNFVPYENAYKQTVMLTAVQYDSYYEQNLVPGPNMNSGAGADFEEPEETDEEDDDSSKKKNSNKKGYEGALVGNSILIDNVGVPLYGKPTNNVFITAIDFDMSAFYPNSIISHNIHSSTLIFKVIIPNNLFDVRGGKFHYHGITNEQLVKKNTDSFDGDIAKEVFDNFQTGNVISTCKKLLNLYGVGELEAILSKEMD